MAKANPIPEMSAVDIAHFHRSYVKVESGCWMWARPVNPKGYGKYRRFGRTFAAHRISYAIHNNMDPGELLACHTCDTPSCVNPEHIFLATPLENIADMIAKGRKRKPFDASPDRFQYATRQRFPSPPRVAPGPLGLRPTEYCVRCGHHRTDDIPARGTAPARCRPCRNARERERKLARRNSGAA